jgi:geranylgeranyl diphosphate synthase type II
VTTATEAGVAGARAEPGFLVRERERVDEALREVVAQRAPAFVERLRKPVEYALSSPGKRIRPVLCVAAYRAATGVTIVDADVYRLSCALEIVHTYSLIHDDLPCMDDDDLRRGRPTLHRVYDNAVAIVVGAALLPLAVDVLGGGAAALGLTDEERAALVIELTDAAGPSGMVGGQLLDLRAESRQVDGEELEKIHKAKTGTLLTASLRIGALAGRASEDLLSALTAYGRALGLAFQIADDLLDVEGSSGTLGKTAGRDRELEKASYPALYGVERRRRWHASSRKPPGVRSPGWAFGTSRNSQNTS